MTCSGSAEAVETEMRSLAVPFIQAAVARLAGAAPASTEDPSPACLSESALATELWQLGVATAEVWSPWVGQPLLATFLQVWLQNYDKMHHIRL